MFCDTRYHFKKHVWTYKLVNSVHTFWIFSFSENTRFYIPLITRLFSVAISCVYVTNCQIFLAMQKTNEKYEKGSYDVA